MALILLCTCRCMTAQNSRKYFRALCRNTFDCCPSYIIQLIAAPVFVMIIMYEWLSNRQYCLALHDYATVCTRVSIPLHTVHSQQARYDQLTVSTILDASTDSCTLPASLLHAHTCMSVHATQTILGSNRTSLQLDTAS